MNNEPAYRSVLRVMLTAPEGEWTKASLAHATNLASDRVQNALEQMVIADWVERHWEVPADASKPLRSRYCLTDRGSRRAMELVG